jgi:hypothetical protein
MVQFIVHKVLFRTMVLYIELSIMN